MKKKPVPLIYSEILNIVCRFNAKKLTAKEAMFEIMEVSKDDYIQHWRTGLWKEQQGDEVK